MPNLTKKDLRKAAIEAAKASNFMQAFKMKWWNTNNGFTQHVPEKDLDQLAMIAWNLLNEKNVKLVGDVKWKLKVNKVCWNEKLLPPDKAKKIHRIVLNLLK